MSSLYKNGIRIRLARGSDAPEMAQLFFDTVHRVNALDYTAAQLAAWAPTPEAAGQWRRRLTQYCALVAEQEGKLLGFAIVDCCLGYLDSLFVHHEHQRRGLGKALLTGIERLARRAGLRYLVTDASVTAEPFFRARGFRRAYRQKRYYRGQVFRQYRMSKILR